MAKMDAYAGTLMNRKEVERLKARLVETIRRKRREYLRRFAPSLLDRA